MDLLGILRIKDSNGNWVSVPGLKGDTGEPFKILGIYATAAALEAAVTDPGTGDVYLVGTTGAYDIYLYLADGWHNTGRYMPKGDQGDPAPQAAITSAVSDWLAANVDPATGSVLARTLAQANAAAPADLVGTLKNATDSVLTYTAEEKRPEFIVGVYTWNYIQERMVFEINAARATADLRFLNLEQGDTVGITDYTTYSIAFGDNGHGWYEGGYRTEDVTADDANKLPYIILVKRNDNANITQEDLDALTVQFHATKTKYDVTAEFTEKAVSDMSKQIGKAKNGFVHLSFDDVGYCILNLANNTFDSVWNEPFFGMIKRLHEEYGAVFSLYICDVANIANLPNTYRTELMNASKWLKFGFHSFTEGSLADTSYETAKAQYETFITNAFSKIGGVNSIDRMPRLNYFAGNLDALKGLRDANCGCIGFLNADDTRNAYYLSDDTLTYLRNHSIWADRTNGLQFMSTVMRLDWFVSGFSSEYDYNTPQYPDPYSELVYRYDQPNMADIYSNLVVFTHEWQTYSSTYVLNAAMVERLEQVCKFAVDYHYDFDFPQNRVPNITSVSIDTEVINNFVTTVKGKWSFGAVQDGGAVVESQTRIHTDPFKASKLIVDIPSGYKVNICWYNSETPSPETFVYNTGWKTSKQTLSGDYYYIIVASKNDNTATLDIADLYTITAVRNINDL